MPNTPSYGPRGEQVVEQGQQANLDAQQTPSADQQTQGAGGQFDLNDVLKQLGINPADLLNTNTKAVDPTVAAGTRIYFDVWGVDPPKGYIESLVKQGLNVAEIRLHELAKPWAARTVYYRDQFANYASSIAQTLGRR